MKYLLIAIFAISSIVWYFNKNINTMTLHSDANLTFSRNSVEARMSITGNRNDTYMVFGISNGFLVADALISGLPLAGARTLQGTYPDLGQCNSASTAALQGRMQRLNVVAADEGVRRELEKARREFQQRLGSEASRLCLHLEGQPLSLMEARQGGVPMTIDDGILTAHLLARSAQVADCAALP